MKIKTIDKLQDLIDEDFIWRKKELIDIKLMLHSTNNLTLCRMGIALLCAHFEGFLKQSANYYVIFISSQNLKISDLQTNFAAIYSSKLFKSCINTEKISVFQNMINDFLNSYMDVNFNVKYSSEKPIIKTGGNPSSTVFKEIFNSIGLDFTPYITKINYIDTDLLSNRHSVVHGEKTYLKIDEFDSTFKNIICIMQNIKDQIIDAAINKKYLR